jgi:hypothetical protein
MNTPLDARHEALLDALKLAIEVLLTHHETWIVEECERVVAEVEGGAE